VKKRHRMTYGSLFAGIGGFDRGLELAGFECAWQVEIDPRRRAVLGRHFPGATRYADVCDAGSQLLHVDLICAGFPCQDLSVAGRRAGLAGPRSGLFFHVARIVGQLRPEWVVIENVPGLLSSNQGRDMGAVLGTLAQLGYGFAYRVLDAQYFGVAQRRRRVFIVGHAGAPWSAPSAVLFEPESCAGDSAPGREARQDVAASLTAGTASGRGVNPPGRRQEDDVNLVASDADLSNQVHGVIQPVAGTLGGGMTAGGWPTDTERMTFVPVLAKPLLALRPGSGGGYRADEQTDTFVPTVVHTLRSAGADASDDGTGRGTPIVAYGVRTAHTAANGAGVMEGLTHSLDRSGSAAVGTATMTIGLGSDPLHTGNLAQPVTGRNGDPGVVAYSLRADASRDGMAKTPSVDAAGLVRLRDPGFTVEVERTPTLDASAPPTVAAAPFDNGQGKPNAGVQGDPAYSLNTRAAGVAVGMAVRRLTPLECERLQGFPDGWTDGFADSVRYGMLGDAVAVPCARWIGGRLAFIAKSRTTREASQRAA